MNDRHLKKDPLAAVVNHIHYSSSDTNISTVIAPSTPANWKPNNKIKVINRKAYGFHDLRYFTLKIYQAFCKPEKNHKG